MKLSRLFAAVTALLLFSIPLSVSADTISKYGMLPIYPNDVKEGTYPVKILSDLPVFSEAEAKISAEDGTLTAIINIEGTEHPISISALNKEISSEEIEGATEVWGEFSLLFDASSLPQEALLVEVPDYDLIEAAIKAYTGEPAAEEGPVILEPAEPINIDMEDGEYSIGLDLIGGSGKAYVTSPALFIIKDKKATARLVWSSSNYDYMRVGSEKYLPINEDGNSVFEIPVTALDEPMTVIADTTAMGTPHEVTYSLTFYSESIGSKSQMPQEAAKRVLIIAFSIIIGGGILNRWIKKRNLV